MRIVCFLFLVLVVWSSGNKALPQNNEAPVDLASGGNLPFSPFGKISPLVAATYYFNPVKKNPIDLDEADTRGQLGSSAKTLNSCRAADGREGMCYDARECVEQNGVPMGRCFHQTSVCCIFDITCGGSTKEEFSYFRNPGFPDTYNKEQMCKTRIERQNSNICQFRMDFLTFDIAQPKDGNCSQDMLVVSGQNENNLIPKICGHNSGHHFYIDVDESGMVSLHVMMVGSYPRRFDIKVTQIPCNSQQTAPAHCLQYYTGTTGVLKSFNYAEGGRARAPALGYPNDMDYTICLRKEPGFCSVSYELATLHEALTANSFGVGALALSVPTGPVLVECPDDYLVIGGVRLCSGRVAPTGRIPVKDNSSTTFHGILTDVTPGPFYVRFVSNGLSNGRGFNLLYRQNPCK